MLERISEAAWLGVIALPWPLLLGCSRGASEGSAKAVAVVPGKQCVVELHGKSGHGAPSRRAADTTYLSPEGNAPGWGGRQWLYFPEGQYEAVRNIVARSIASAGCDRVIIHGFSNGASAAAKLFCRGERFDNHAIGYVIDDPVADHGVEGCIPPPGVRIRLYWTGALATAVDGWACSLRDFTCEGGTTIGIDRYSAALGATKTPSVHQTHEAYALPPDYAAWFSR